MRQCYEFNVWSLTTVCRSCARQTQPHVSPAEGQDTPTRSTANLRAHLLGVGPVPEDGEAVGHHLGAGLLAKYTHQHHQADEEDHFHLQHHYSQTSGASFPLPCGYESTCSGASTGTGEEFRSHVAASFWRHRENTDARPRENARRGGVEKGWRGDTEAADTPLGKKKREVTKTRRDAGAWTLWGNPRFRSRMRKPESFSRECATQQAVSSAVRRRPPPAWSPLDAACVRASDNCWTLVLTPNPERRGLVSPRCDEEKKRGGLSVSNDAVRRTSDAHVLQATF